VVEAEVAFAFCHRPYLPAKGMNWRIPKSSSTSSISSMIRWDLVIQQYDEMVKAGVALKDGTATAEHECQR
jgi:TnpA family transposase